MLANYYLKVQILCKFLFFDYFLILLIIYKTSLYNKFKILYLNH